MKSEIEYKDIITTVKTLIDETEIEMTETEKEVVTDHITKGFIREVDFYTKRFYMIKSVNGFVSSRTDSSGRDKYLTSISPASASVFNDIISCEYALKKCKEEHPHSKNNFEIVVFNY